VATLISFVLRPCRHLTRWEAGAGRGDRRPVESAIAVHGERSNEVLCKSLCHNLTCLIQEQETLGIVPIFWKDEVEATEPETLPMRRLSELSPFFARLAVGRMSA
jgi:hypothetical protein